MRGILKDACRCCLVFVSRDHVECSAIGRALSVSCNENVSENHFGSVPALHRASMEAAEGGGASSSGVTPAKKKRTAIGSLHETQPTLKKPRNRPDLSVEVQVTHAIADNLLGYSCVQLDGHIVEGPQ
eukprot:4319008-Amphidinium_carterae.2